MNELNPPWQQSSRNWCGAFLYWMAKVKRRGRNRSERGTPVEIQSSVLANRPSSYVSSRAISSDVPTATVIWADIRRTIDDLRSPETAVDGDSDRLVASGASGAGIAKMTRKIWQAQP
jgi:hypothetical protein